jgi:hypothetical protein
VKVEELHVIVVDVCDIVEKHRWNDEGRISMNDHFQWIGLDDLERNFISIWIHQSEGTGTREIHVKL